MARHRFDPLATTRRPHWLTVSDMHHNLVTYEALPAGADLREVLPAALTQCAGEGWEAENDGAYGFAFIVKGSERWPVNLTPADPSDCAGPGHAFLTGRGVPHEPDSAGPVLQARGLVSAPATHLRLQSSS